MYIFPNSLLAYLQDVFHFWRRAIQWGRKTGMKILFLGDDLNRENWSSIRNHLIKLQFDFVDEIWEKEIVYFAQTLSQSKRKGLFIHFEKKGLKHYLRDQFNLGLWHQQEKSLPTLPKPKRKICGTRRSAKEEFRTWFIPSFFSLSQKENFLHTFQTFSIANQPKKTAAKLDQFSSLFDILAISRGFGAEMSAEKRWSWVCLVEWKVSGVIRPFCSIPSFLDHGKHTQQFS